jgi:hypothetical protein
MAAAVCITEFTDPGCPWAYSAEPIRARLRWLYGEHIDFEARMVVLSESPQDYLDKGFTPDKMAASFKQIARDHGMPFDTSQRPRMAATRDAGIDPEELARWTQDEAVDHSLREDMALAREPLPAARVLDAKLANWSGGRRYTCPSYEIVRRSDGVRIAVPGFQPFAAYDVVTANLVPDMPRREPPADVSEVLDWALVPARCKARTPRRPRARRGRPHRRAAGRRRETGRWQRRSRVRRRRGRRRCRAGCRR